MIAYLQAVTTAVQAAAKGTVIPFSPINTALLTVMITVLIAFWTNQRANRKMTIQVNGEVRKEFIDEMKALRDEVKGLREENESLRKEVRGLHSTIDAMRQANRSTQDIVADQLKAVETVAMGRVLRVLDDKE